MPSGGGAKGFGPPPDHAQQSMRFMGLGLDRFTQGSCAGTIEAFVRGAVGD